MTKVILWTTTDRGVTVCREIDFDAAVNLMDDELREALNGQFEEGQEQTFLDAYVIAHAKKFGEEFAV